MKYYPIMGTEYRESDYASIDLSVHSSSLYELKDTTIATMDLFASDIRLQTGAKFLYGGYLEHRDIYTSTHFTSDIRNIHLGVDIWGAANSKLYAVDDLRLHSMAYNDAALDYGYTLVFFIKTLGLYLLLGHLSKQSLVGKSVGDEFSAGEEVADLGNPIENGGWLPHVHIQLIKNLQNNVGDYPGVCSIEQLSFYENNCPDPLITLPGLIPI